MTSFRLQPQLAQNRQEGVESTDGGQKPAATFQATSFAPRRTQKEVAPLNQGEPYRLGGLLVLVMALSFSHAQFQVGPTQVVPESRYAGTATGTVFNDANGDQKHDPGEVGIKGVLVSNGREVTQTDAQGRYRLPVDDGTVLFITKPSGYAVPVNDEQLPRFFYIHQPEGSPEALGLEFPGVAPTGLLPPAVDFP